MAISLLPMVRHWVDGRECFGEEPASIPTSVREEIGRCRQLQMRFY
jgi:hypothetical protein